MHFRARILHLRASGFVGGPEKQLLRYAQQELDGPFAITLGTFAGRDEGDEFLQAIESQGIRSLSLPDKLWGRRSAFGELKRFLQTERIDLLCTHGYKADIIGLFAGQATSVPVVPFLRGWTQQDWKVRFYEFIDRQALHRSDRIVTLSKIQAERVGTKYGLAEKIRVVQNGIDLPTFVREQSARVRSTLLDRFALPPESFLIVCAGRLSPEKGTADLLRAAALLKRTESSIRWIIFGDGALRDKLSAYAQELDLGDCVIFAGFEKNLRDVIPGFDLLVNPSHSEEMPNIVLEGMAARIPIVATAVGGVREIAGPDPAIELIPPARPDIMARVVVELKTNGERAEKLASAGYDRVSKVFSPEAQLRAIHSLYRELIPERYQDGKSISITDSLKLERSEQNVQVPFISVVIPVRNEELHLGNVLDKLLSQDYPHDRFEIIVADGMSNDRTAEIIDYYSRKSSVSIRRVENPVRRSSAGRNAGFRASRGEYILFIDGHCYLPSMHLLSDSAALFKETGADCLCRPQPLDAPGNTIFQCAVAAVRASTLGHGLDSTIFEVAREAFIPPMSSGASYKRSVFERIGTYDEQFDACEDVEFNFRVQNAGMRAYTSPRLKVSYQPRATLSSLWHQMKRYGSGRYRLKQKHPEASSWAQIVPGAFSVWLVIGLFASLFSQWAAWVFGASMLVYLLAVAISSLLILRSQGWRVGVRAPLIFFVVHVGLGAGYISEMIDSRLGRSSVGPPDLPGESASRSPVTIPGRSDDR